MVKGTTNICYDLLPLTKGRTVVWKTLTLQLIYGRRTTQLKSLMANKDKWILYRESGKSFISKNIRITRQCSSQCIEIVGRVLESAFEKGTMKSWRECKNKDTAGYTNKAFFIMRTWRAESTVLTCNLGIFYKIAPTEETVFMQWLLSY